MAAEDGVDAGGDSVVTKGGLSSPLTRLTLSISIEAQSRSFESDGLEERGQTV